MTLTLSTTRTLALSPETRAFLSQPDFVRGLRGFLVELMGEPRHSYDLIRLPLELLGMPFSEVMGLLERCVGRKVAGMILAGRKPGMLGGQPSSLECPVADPKPSQTFPGIPELSRIMPEKAKTLTETNKIPAQKVRESLPHVGMSLKDLKHDVSPESGKEGGGERLARMRVLPGALLEQLDSFAERVGVEPSAARNSVERFHNAPRWVLSTLLRMGEIGKTQRITNPTGLFVQAAKGILVLEERKVAARVAQKVHEYPEEALELVGTTVMHAGERLTVSALQGGTWAVLSDPECPGVRTLVSLGTLLKASGAFEATSPLEVHTGASGVFEEKRSPLSPEEQVFAQKFLADLMARKAAQGSST